MRTVKLSEVNKDVKVVDGKLFFGEKEVKDCNFIKEDSVAALYTIRVQRELYKVAGQQIWGLATTLDLIDGKFWLCGGHINMWKDQEHKSLPSAFYSEWSSVEKILNEFNSDTAGKEWAVFEEEDFEGQWNEFIKEDQ